MMRLINDVSSYRSAVNSWVLVNSASVATGFNSPDGGLSAFKVSAINSLAASLRHPSLTRVDSLYRFGIWMWTDSGQPFGGYTRTIVAGSSFTDTFSISNVPTLYYSDCNSVVVDSFYTQFGGPAASSGSYFYAWQPHLASQRQYLEVLPEYDFKDTSEKIESVHTTRAGNRYVYKWGDNDAAKFGVKFVTSSQRHVLNNSWWAGNQKLLFVDTPGSFTWDVQIISKKKPIDSFVKPYIDMWKGTIELGSY